jgi:signal transduction histidine kinase
MNINPFVVSELLVGISCLSFGLFVYLKDPKRKLYQIWLFFNLSISCWGFLGLFATSVHNPYLSVFLWSLALGCGVIWIPIFFLHFIYQFCEVQYRKFLYFSYFITIIFSFLILTRSLFAPIPKLFFDSLFYVIPNSYFYYLMVFWWFLLYTISLYLLIRAYSFSNDYKKKQIGYIFAGVGVGAIGGSMNFLPLLNLDIYPWGNFAIPFYPIFMVYGMTRHELMDIRIVIRKTIIYSIFTFLLSTLYFAFVFFIQRVFLPQTISTTSLWFGITGILFIAILFKPLELVFHRFLERCFFKGTIFEISEQKAKLETELERQERLKSVGIMAAGMAHEIKNPLTAIKTFADYLPQKYQDPDFREKFHRIVEGEVDRIKNIVTDLLLFSKPSEPCAKQVNAKEILRGILDLMSNQFLQYKINVDTYFCQDDNFWADPDQMKQAFLNLILNAIDAMKEKGGTLKISTQDISSNKLRIKIQDTGCGIPIEKLSHIFDPFFTSKEEGTGLGLAVTHSVIEKNGGRISVESEEGVGTKFLIDLPKPK